ncbi:uncharacterized protein [Ptychodera flava]|uniref:uncharacterized protein isoform X1 n=1 Tax=Ptychodera flava TaxID=63121 RepID=UPI00396A88C8
MPEEYRSGVEVSHIASTSDRENVKHWTGTSKFPIENDRSTARLHSSASTLSGHNMPEEYGSGVEVSHIASTSDRENAKSWTGTSKFPIEIDRSTARLHSYDEQISSEYNTFTKPVRISGQITQRPFTSQRRQFGGSHGEHVPTPTGAADMFVILGIVASAITGALLILGIVMRRHKRREPTEVEAIHPQTQEI